MEEEFNPEKLMKEFSEIDEFKELNAYLKSPENLKACEPFELLNQKYISLQRQYANSYRELSKKIEGEVCRREYGKGGVYLHGGYYSPSALDLVTNCNKGRLLKRLTKNSRYDYEYLFDSNNRLICIHQYNNYNGIPELATTDLFIYNLSSVLALTFNSDESLGLSFISECQYKDGLLVRYETALCELFYGGGGCTEINIEEFEYKDGLLFSLYCHRYTPSIHILTQNKYTFSRDSEGRLSTYTARQIGGFQANTPLNYDSVVYNVNVKRK